MKVIAFLITASLCCAPGTAQVIAALEGGYPGQGLPVGDISLSRDGTVIAGAFVPSMFCAPQTLPPFTMRADGTGFQTFTIPGGSTGAPSCPRVLNGISPSGDGTKLLALELVRSFFPFSFNSGPLWIVDTTTGSFLQLAPVADQAVLSEDGSTVAYSAGVAVNANGTNRRSLGLKPTGIDATGSKVVGYRWMGSHADAFIVNGDGTGLLNLTNTPGFDESRTAISGDGTIVAVPRTVVPSGVTACFNRGWTDVLVMNSDGSGARTLARLPGCPNRNPALTTTGDLLAVNVTGHPAPNPMQGGMFLFDTSTGAVRVHFPWPGTGPLPGPIFVIGCTLTADGTRLLGDLRTPNGSRLAVIDLALPDLKVLGPERIGSTETVQVAAAPGSLFFLAASDTPGSLPIQPFGTLGLDPARISLLAQGVIGSTSTFRLPFPVPNAPSLVGFRLYLQALALEPTLLAGSFTNVVEVNLRQ